MSRQWQISFVASLLLHVAVFAAVPLATYWLGNGKGDPDQVPQASFFQVIDVPPIQGEPVAPAPDAVSVPAPSVPDAKLASSEDTARLKESKASVRSVAVPSPEPGPIEPISAEPSPSEDPPRPKNSTVKALAAAITSPKGAVVEPLVVPSARIRATNFGDGESFGGEKITVVTQPGGAFVEAKPRYRLNQAPPYPPLARRRKQEGVVLVAASINALGRVAEVRIKESSGSRVLDESALKAVHGWEFEPARRGLTTIPSTVEIPIEFRLSR